MKRLLQCFRQAGLMVLYEKDSEDLLSTLEQREEGKNMKHSAAHTDERLC